MHFHTLGPVQGNGLNLFCVLNGKGASLLRKSNVIMVCARGESQLRGALFFNTSFIMIQMDLKYRKLSLTIL